MGKVFMAQGLAILVLGQLAWASPPIPNGVPTTAFPEVVELKIKVKVKEGVAGCTGTLVGPGTVLTAGHCIECLVPHANPHVTFEFGGKTIPVLKTVCSDGKGFEGENDLAIVLFDAKQITKKVTYPKLEPEAPLYGGGRIELVTVVGFGCNDTDAYFDCGSGVKRYGEAAVLSVSPLREFSSIVGYRQTPGITFYDWDGTPTGEMVGISMGDSGGPAFSQRHGIYGVAHTIAGPDPKNPESVREFKKRYINQNLTEGNHTLVSSYFARAFLEDSRKFGANFEFYAEPNTKTGTRIGAPTR